MTRVLVAVAACVHVMWHLGGAPSPSMVLLVAASLAIAGIAVLVVIRPHDATDLPARAAALRERARRSVFVRLLDPGAAGRPRPRAPSPGPGRA